MADGFVLNVPPQMIKNLNDANKALKNIGDSSKRVQTSVDNVFRELTHGQINAFINKLGSVKEAMDEIGLDNVGKLNLGALQQSLAPTTDAIVKMSENMGKMGDVISSNIELTKTLFTELNKVANVKSKSKGKSSLNGGGGDDKPEGYYFATKGIEDWKNLNKQVDVYQEKIDKLKQKTREYEEKVRIAKERGGVIRMDDTNQYKRYTTRIKEYEDEIKKIEEEQKAIIKVTQLDGERIKKKQAIQELAQKDAKKENNNDFELEQLNEKLRKEEKLSKEKEDSHKKQMQNIESARKAEERKAKAEEAQQKAKKRALEQERKEREKNIGFSGAMAYSRETKSIKEEIHAIKLLENAKKNLSKETKGYQDKLDNLNDEIKRHKEHVDEVNGKTKRLSGSQRHLMDISGQLARKLALVFSVSQIQGYITKMIEVRGEFELQNRALEAIIQNKAEANKLWNQTVNLAVASPFRVKELITYTKQLAAYRVESDKLYKTTKMLADVSAGLGVDMNRLILAYGQVKAANYLRGTELRQFSEAGINILQELANQFSEVEGRAYSVGEVFEMVSKRMVSFEDVEKVFERITSEGGIFYRMQEIQAETLQGQISNLKDSIDIMFNEIGKDYDSLLKWGVKFVKSFVDNFSTIASYLTTAIATFGAYKVSAFLAGESAIDFAKKANVVGRHFKGTISAGKLLIALGKNISKTFKSAALAMKAFAVSNPILLAATVIGGSILKIKGYLNGLDEAVLDVTNAINARAVQVKKLEEAYDALIDKQKESIKKGSEYDFFDEKLKNLQDIIDYAKQNAIEIPVKLQEVTKENIDDTIQKAKELINLSNSFAYTIGKHTAAAGKGIEFGGLIGQNYETDLKQFNVAINETMNSIDRMGDLMNELEVNQGNLNKKASHYYSILKDGKKNGESTIDWLFRASYAIKVIREQYDGLKNVKFADSIIKNYDKLKRREDEAYYEIQKITNKIKDEWGDLSQRTPEEKRIISLEIQANLQKNDYSDIAIETLKRIYEGQLGIVIPLKFEAKGDSKNFLEGWRELYNNFINEEDLDKKWVKRIPNTEQGAMSTRTTLAEALKDTLKGYEETIKYYKNGAEALKDSPELKEAEEAKRQIELALNWLIGEDDKKKKGRTNQEEIKMRIELIEKMHRAYEDLNNTFGKMSSKTQVIEGYTKSFNDIFKKAGLSIGDIDFMSESDVVEALKKLMPFAQKLGKEFVDILNVAISKHKVQIEVADTKETQEDFVKSVDKMFEKLNLTNEFKKLGIPKDLAKQLFGFDYLSLEDIRARVEGWDTSNLGKKALEDRERMLKKITEMENKSYIERVKLYTKYLVEGQREAVKIKMEELHKLKELEESSEFTPDQKEIIKNKIQKETQEKLQSNKWKEFKDTNLYSMMFGDVENLGTQAINDLVVELNKLKASLKDLPANEFKEIVTQIEKLQDEVNKRNPFKALRDSRLALVGIGEEGDLQAQLMASQAKIDEAQKTIDVIDAYESASSKGDFTALSADLIESYNAIAIGASLSQKSVKDVRKEQEGIVEANKKANDEAYQGLDLHTKYRNTLLSARDAWGEIGQQMNKVFDSVDTLMGAFGVGEDDVAGVAMDMARSLSNSVISAIQLGVAIKAAGIEAKSAMGIIGWIALAIETIAGLVASIFKAHDDALVAKINKQKDKVDVLKKSYDKLKEAMDKAWNTDQMMAYYRQMKVNLENTLNAQRSALSAAEAIKNEKKRKEEVEELRESIEVTEKALAELSEDTNRRVTDAFSDIRSSAEEWTNAWYDAFKETGDGLGGLEKNLDKFIEDLAKKQAALSITTFFTDKWGKELKKYIDAEGGDLKFEPEEIKRFAESIKEDLPELHQLLLEFFQSIGGATGSTKSALSGLQKGIQGITEQTAQIIAAYLNSIRFFVSENNQKIDKVMSLISDGSFGNNTILGQLKLIANQTEAINDLLQGLSVGGHSRGGLGLKVFMD